MKPLILVTGGRGGSDFFQGLLDDHDQILQIPGILRINSEFISIRLLVSFQRITLVLLNIHSCYNSNDTKQK